MSDSSGPVTSQPGAPRTSGPGSPIASRTSGGGKPGSLVSRGVAAAADALLRLTRFGYSEAKVRGGKALQDFSRRPEQTRQRVYAFGSYGAVVLLTLAAQLYEPNSLHAYVKVEPVALPEATVIFVRNDSNRTWKNVRLTLNGKYGYQRSDVAPNGNITLSVSRFAAYDQNGKAAYAPKETVPRLITVDCDRGHYELDLEQAR